MLREQAGSLDEPNENLYENLHWRNVLHRDIKFAAEDAAYLRIRKIVHFR